MVTVPIEEVFDVGTDENTMLETATGLRLDLHAPTAEDAYTHIGLTLAHIDPLGESLHWTLRQSDIPKAAKELEDKLGTLGLNKTFEADVMLAIHWG
jgi:hypothetical protein